MSAISAVSLVGVAGLMMDRERLARIVPLLSSFAAGSLLGAACLHLLPEAFERLGAHGGPWAPGLALAGLLASFAAEAAFRRFHEKGSHPGPCVAPAAILLLASDALHNFIDGLLIGAAFLVSVPAGLAATTAVLLHEVPQEIGDFGVLVQGGFSVREALAWNVATALTAVAGGAIALLVGPKVEGFAVAMLPVAAGGFLYIACCELIPEIQADQRPGRPFKQVAAMLLGVVLMAAGLGFH